MRQEVKAMTRREVIVRAIAKQITWIQAAWICGITDRHMRRLKERYLGRGYDGLVDQRGGKPRRKRIAVETIAQICELRRERHADFSVQHFWEKVREEHRWHAQRALCPVGFGHNSALRSRPGACRHPAGRGRSSAGRVRMAPNRQSARRARCS